MKVSKEQQRLFDKNAKFLLKKVPHLSMYIDSEIPHNISLYEEDSEIDVLINGERFYGIDARSYTHQQIEAYLISPSVIEGNPPVPDEERSPTHLTLFNKLNRSLRKNKVMALMDRQRIDSSTTFVFGIGLGYHLYPIVAHTRCRELVITEAEPVFLLLSMYFIDWGKIYKTLKDRVAIVISRDPQGAFSIIRSHVHQRNPGVLQTMFHFCHYHSEFMDAIHKKYQEKAYVFFDGLGFYDDEKLMARNSILNMYMSKWRFCGDRANPVDASAVIVGAGPSLNNDLEWLRNNKDNLVIFSGGSALQTLLVNGIIPDFHVEIENIALNYELLKPLTERYDLSKTILICSSTMDTKSSLLFNRRIWFLREGVTASSLLAPDLPPMSWQNPTVVNTASAASLHLGFRNVILLGADFGTKNPDVHHSKDTSYETHEELKKVDFKFPDTVLGNFGGLVHTNTHMMTGIQTMKYLTREFRGAKLFNGSDGAMLERVTPVRTARYKFAPLQINKANLVSSIYNNVREINWGHDLGPSLIDDMDSSFKEYILILRNIFAQQLKRQKDFILFLSGIYDSLASVPEPYNRFNPAISGTISTQTLIMMYWWRRIPEASLAEYERTCRRQWSVFLNVIEKDFAKFLKSIRQELPLVRPELFDDKGNLIVEAKPSVQNAE